MFANQILPPTFQTSRLILGAPTAEDWPDYLQMMRSARSIHMGGPFTQEAAWGGVFCHDIAGWSLFGLEALMIENRNSGQCLGQISANYGPLFSEPELGWLLYDHAEGKGYAFEAAETLKNWLLSERQINTLVSYIAPENTRSITLAKKLGGGVLDKNAKKPDLDDLVFRYR